MWGIGMVDRILSTFIGFPGSSTNGHVVLHRCTLSTERLGLGHNFMVHCGFDVELKGQSTA